MAGEMRAATKRMRSSQTRLVRSLRMRMRLQMEKIEGRPESRRSGNRRRDQPVSSAASSCKGGCTDLGGRLIAKKEAKGRLAKWLRKNGLALESRYGRENKIWP